MKSLQRRLSRKQRRLKKIASPEIIDKVEEEEEEEEEEDTPRRRSTRSTPSKGTTPSTNSKKEKPLSKKAQKDIIKARKSRMEKRVIEEMDDETGEESMRTVFIDPETNEECNEDGSLKAK
jgi:FtsZ-interacting cell division protein YlmF